jgi:hypothetical protein
VSGSPNGPLNHFCFFNGALEVNMNMKRMAGLAAAAAMVAGALAPLAAQTKTVTGEQSTITATVEAIDHGNRTVSLKGPKGNYVTIDVPANVARFDSIKVGDKLTATYYENIVLNVLKPGEAPKDTAQAAVTRSDSTKPGATAAKQRTITAEITAIDMKVPSISFKGPNGWAYSSKVQDKDALSKVKVGDKVDITWTEALLVSMDTPKK